MDDLDDLDFSFSCNKCSFSTKSIMEIKVHAMEHKKAETNQTENDKGSSKNASTNSSDAIQGDDDANNRDTDMVDIPMGSSDAILGDDANSADTDMVDIPMANLGDHANSADTAMVDIPVGKLDDGNDAGDLRALGNDNKTGEDDEMRTPSGVVETGAQVDSSTQSVPYIPSTGENQEQSDADKIDQGTQPATSNVKTEANDGLTAAEAANAFVDLLMVDMGTQMSPMPVVTTPRGRGRPTGSTGAAKRKANIPVREQIEEPEEIEESTEDEEMEGNDDEDYEPPVSNHALDDVKVGAPKKRGRPPLTRSKLKAKKKTVKRVVPKKKYKCANCDFECEVNLDMGSHMKDVHQIEVKIEELSEESDNENNLLLEGMLPPKRKPLDSSIPDDRYSCNICKEYKCKFKKDLNRHKHEAHNITTVEYKYQSRVANDRYKCTQCSYNCKFQRQLRNHRRRAHPRPKPVARSKTGSGGVRIRKPKPRVPADRYKCAESECDFTCKFKGTLKDHRMEKHKKEQQPKQKSSKMKQLECEHCGKLIRGTQHHLLRHMKTHTGEKPYECDICGRVFAEKGRLNIHKPIHNEARPYLCEECGKSFKRAINLRMHRKIHVEVKPYQCELCAYRCNRHDTLNLHMKRKHLKLRRVLCTYCGRKFFSEKECQAHAGRKHLPRPTPFQCTLCPAAFPFAYNLRAHMKKHPEHKPHRCEFCGFESRSKASLRDHRRQHTDGASWDNDPKPYKCGWCEFASKSQYYIKEHERQHTGEKEKKCDLCDYATTTSSNLYKHRKRQHGIIGMPARQMKGRGRPPRANALLAGGGKDGGSVSTVPRQHHPMHPVTITITPEDLVTHRPQQSEEERAAEAIEDSATEIVQIPMHMYNKRPGAVMYTHQRDKIIGSVITDALAEARNVVQTQSDIYATQMLPTTLPSLSIATSGLTAPSALHSSNTLTMAHTAGLPHGTVVNIPEGMISATGIPVTAQGIHIPVTVAMQNMLPPGPATMFNMMHYP